MSDFLRNYLYEQRNESNKRARQEKIRERDRKIEAEIQADKVALIKELDKGIDWVPSEPALPSKNTSKPPQTSLTPQHVNIPIIPDDIAHKRLKDLKHFILSVQHIASIKGIEINVMFLPVSKQMLLDEIKKTKPKNGIWNITLSSFEQDWKLPFRKTICGVVLSSKQREPFFFRNIFNK